jgi:hypothetical protein
MRTECNKFRTRSRSVRARKQQGAQLCFNGDFPVDRSEYPPLASRYDEFGGRFIPRLYATSLNFQGYVGHNEAVRYQLQIEATNFLSPIYVIEVAWNGI